jgi:hypothetical protein
MPARPFLDSDLATRQVVLVAKDVVFLKSVLEASEGLAALFAEQGGDLTIATPWSRVNELDELLHDLCTELNFELAEPVARCRR